ERAYLPDALDGARALVGRKFMVAKNCQSLLQAELEPVAASDSIACPIVKVFVRDDGFDIGEIRVSRSFAVGQHIFVVEDVQALVLHRADIEIGHGDNVEHVEVVLSSEDLFIPGHGTLQRIHRVGRERLLAMFDIYGEVYAASAHGGELVRQLAEIAGNQGEQVGRFGKGVVPDGKVPAIGQVAALVGVAVRKKQWRLDAPRLDPNRVDRQYVRAIEEIGDAPETLGLAL